MDIIGALPEKRQTLATSIKLIADSGKSLGGASNEFFKKTLEKIKNGELKESEWFGMEMQSRPIYSLAESIWDTHPLNK